MERPPDGMLDSSGGEGIEVAPYNYSTDSTVSMETEDSHDLISDSPLASRNIPSNYHHVSFSFLDKGKDIKEEVEHLSEDDPNHIIDNATTDSHSNSANCVGLVVGEDSNGSTAEEIDTGPFDSGTTDPGYVYEDNGHNGNKEYCRYGDEGVVIGYSGLTEFLVSPKTMNRRPYENWSIIEENEEMIRKRKTLTRSKSSRIGVRQRAPQPLPRQIHLKQKTPRLPVPMPRKRRVLGRSRPPTRNLTSEGDMEQADEMGDEGGDDDGFVDGGDAGLGKRKTKKKLCINPSLPVISPSSSPSSTPISRRRSTSRKNRVKPKLRKNLKPTLASADISTQETTTPGPASSDTDNEEVELVADSNHRLIEDIAEEDMSIRGPSVARRQTAHPTPYNGVGVRKTEPVSKTQVESNGKKTKPQNSKNSLTTKHLAPKQLSTTKNDVSSSGGKPHPQNSNDKVAKDDVSTTTAPLSSETNSDNSESDKKKKTGSATGIPMTAKSSPQLSRKIATDQENQRPRATNRQAGTFVSKRLSVAAMINQFDTADTNKQPVPPSSPSPVIKRSTVREAESGKKPPPLNKPVSLSRPDIKPKPLSPVFRESVYGSVTVGRKPSMKSVTKDTPPVAKDTPTIKSPSPPNPKPLESSGSHQKKLTPPLPPKPKSPPAVTKPPIPVKSINDRTSSTSTSSLSSSSSSSVSKPKVHVNEEMQSKSKQSINRKSSLVRTSSNSSLSNKSGSTVKTAVTKMANGNQQKVSPAANNGSSNKVTIQVNAKRPVKVADKKTSSTTNPDDSGNDVPTYKLVKKTSQAGNKTSKDQLAGNSLENKRTSSKKSVTDVIKQPNTVKSTEMVSAKGNGSMSTKSGKKTETEKYKHPPQESVNNKSGNNKVESESVIDRKQSNTDITKSEEIKKDTSVDIPVQSKPPLRPQKSSSRRPPPEPPTSPPPGATQKKPYPRVRSPPPPPPVSPLKDKPVKESSPGGDREACHSPRNYEEFVPSIFRSSSIISGSLPLVSPPIIQKEVKTQAEYSSNSNTNLSAYEDIVLPIVNTDNDKTTPTNQKTDTSSTYTQPKPVLPPPLPPRNYNDDPVIPLPTMLGTVDENQSSGSTVLRRNKSTDALNEGRGSSNPPPLPSQPIPKRKSLFGINYSPLLKRKEIPVIVKSTSSLPVSSLSPPVTKQRDTENVYEEIPGNFPNKTKPLSVQSEYSHYEVADNFIIKPRPQPTHLRDSSPSSSLESIDGCNRRFSASICVGTTSGLSPVSLRRANSDKMKNPRLQFMIMQQDSLDSGTNSSLQRTSSMDILDERMNQSPFNSLDDIELSSGDEGEPNGSLSPHQSLPTPPKAIYDYIPPHKDKNSVRQQDNGYDEEQEPLYQHINHLDFTSTPWMSRNTKITNKDTITINTKVSNTNQLDMAKQLAVNHRKLWCEQPEVIKSGVLVDMNDQDRKLQEAMFEVITSEASYLRSLDVLIEHFMDDPGMNPNLPFERRIINKRQHHVVFSNVKEIREISAKFLALLRERQEQSIIIKNICDIIKSYAESEFGCYIAYCTNQVYQMREITEMLYTNTMFIDYVKRLESHKRCQHLSLTSFLLLPMQRITRLPLLVLAILNRLSSDHPLHNGVEETLRAVQKLVTACNDGARQMERTEELHQIHNQLNFGKLKPFPLVSISRRLERKGSLVMLVIEQRLFGKPRVRRVPVYVFALTDYILITKRKKGPKGEVVYKVIDYASKAVVEIEKLKISRTITYPKHTFGEHETIPKATWMVSNANEPHSFLLMLLENAVQKGEKYVFVCQNDTECTRWMESIKHPAKEKQKEDETIYETWDCPQVQAVYDYIAKQHDEISLTRGDIVKVLRKMADGWYEGEKLRDRQWGWFPSNFTVEIENAHTRARNLKERHRLLSSTHLNTQQFSLQFTEAVK